MFFSSTAEIFGIAGAAIQSFKVCSMATIAIDATYAVDPEPTGVGISTRRLVESLVALNPPHHFIVCYRLSRWQRRKDFIRLNPAGGRAPSQWSTRLFQEPWTFWLPRQAELFHSLGQRPAPFHFRKEVVTVNDVFPLSSREYSAPEFQRKFSALLIEAVRRATLVITPSRYTASELERTTGLSQSTIRVVPYGVDVPAELPSAEERRQTREDLFGKGRELVLVVGAVQTRKNTLGALAALDRLPDRYHMILAGGDGYGSDAVRAALSKPKLRGRVNRLGYVRRVDLEKLYKSASVFLFPSFEEGFGLPVLEAMAHGLPVVASGTSSLPEVGGNAALYFNPHDPEECAFKVVQLTEDAALHQCLIERGLARAQEFSWLRTARQTLSVYEEAFTLSR